MWRTAGCVFRFGILAPEFPVSSSHAYLNRFYDQGTGVPVLVLAIAHWVLRGLTAANIEVSSAPGEGAVFVLDLPVGTTAEPQVSK